MARQTSLTEGRVFTVLLQFSLPFLFTNILQALYGAADLFMVGRFSTSAGVSAVATGGQVMQTITGLAVGLTTGGTIMVAQAFGARKRKELANAAATAFGIFGLLALCMTAGGLFLAGPICELMQTPKEAYSLTCSYLSICSTGIIFIIGFNTIGGILRGMGDSKTPFYFMTLACVTNMIADFLFVGVFRWGAPGAAYATVMAQGVSLFLSVMYLLKKGYFHTFYRLRPSFQPHAAQHIMAVGLPIAVQDGLVNISFLMITAIINSMGLTASAAVGVVEKLIVFSMLPATAFAAAVSTMTAQNKGAGLMKRAFHCLDAGIFLSLFFGAACFVAAQLNPNGLVGLFTSDPAVIEAGASYLRSYSMDCILVCFVFCMNTFFSGSGHAFFPLIHSCITTFLLRIPLSYLLSRTAGASMFAIGFAAPAASFLSLLLCFAYMNRTYGVKYQRHIRQSCRF